MFRIIDVEGKGFVNRENLKRIMSAVASQAENSITEEQVDQALAAADTNGNGEITLDELKTAMSARFRS
jgi:Ca2+-binding EF-hand superfamily protein